MALLYEWLHVSPANRDLQQLYSQLVEGGILTEAEFWKGRQNLLKDSLRGSRDARQQPGFKTAMITEQAGEGGSRKVKHATCLPLQHTFACPGMFAVYLQWTTNCIWAV